MSQQRRRVYSGTPWEPKVAYCRASRAGNFIAVSGTVAAGDDGKPVAPGDAYAQTLFALRKIEKALEGLGSCLADVVRTRVFLVDFVDFDEFARAHREVFAGIDPAATAVQVSALVAPQYVVEIEADAVVTDDR
ncbi:MAG TPA: RidA family protein [Candidatus Binatia bacterium]|jgi:enamine deaminase RidA (YjgF/YER057c/UK114 family)